MSASTTRIRCPLLAQLVARLQAVGDLPSWAPPLTILNEEAFSFLRLKSTFVLRIRYASASAVFSPAVRSLFNPLGVTPQASQAAQLFNSFICFNPLSKDLQK